MRETIVLGAGMVGVSTALALQARGHAVTLVDRRGAGEETSHGNAGIIQAEAAEPYAIPRDVKTLMRYALGRSNDVTYDLASMARMLPALASYFRFSAPAKHHEIAKTYAQLIARSTSTHEPLIQASGADNLIRRDGFAMVLRDDAEFEASAREAERLKTLYGIQSQTFDGASYRREEPALITPIGGAVVWPNTWTCSDPGGLTKAYAQLFEKQGGRFLTGDASSLKQTSAGRAGGGSAWQVDTEEGPITATDAVIALGPWAPELLKRFGYGVKMVLKRGYHGHFQASLSPRRPFLDKTNSVVLSPMTNGLRMTSGAALVAQNAPSNPVQLDRAISNVREILDIGAPTQDAIWVGHRPCLPDMLPLAGRAPKHDGLWFHFGHGHQGFTLGPATSDVLLDAMDGRTDAITTALDPRYRSAILSW
ncbi:MAG: FAD-binding oxidoreductase [Rhodobacteraceae bacterium]|nr:FAD-binding oxidoreductase [Paracoccaceae bacterium]